MLAAPQLADVVVAELDEHEVTSLEVVVNLLPAPLAQVGAQRASGLGAVDGGDALLVEDAPGLRAPSPHARAVAVGVLHRGVACDEDHGLALLAFHARGGGDEFAVVCGQHHLLQGLQLRMRAGQQPLGGTASVQLSAELGGVDIVEVEVVAEFPGGHLVVLRGGDLVEVHEGDVHLLCHLAGPAAEGPCHAHRLPFPVAPSGCSGLRSALSGCCGLRSALSGCGLLALPLGGSGLLPGREAHQDRVGPQRARLAHELSQILAVAIDGLHASLVWSVLQGDHHGVRGGDAADGGAAASAVEGAVVVVP